MADDTITLCSYCGSQHTQLDYALHRVSNNHVKKVQRKVLHRGFTSACLVCNFALKDLRHAELHLQEKTHTDRMKSFLVDSYLCNDKCTCRSCGITFYNEVALEAHCFSASHNSIARPKLDDLSRLLSGLYGKQFVSICNDLCCICDVNFHGVEDAITHLFTAAHVSRLRSSSCMVCKKEFTHASDRELHINSFKHQIALRKCKDLLEEGRTHALLGKGGYPCMLCMIWCNSWFCLELHLLDKHHIKASALSRAKCPISAQIAFLAVVEGIGQSVGCDELTMSSWREWRRDASKEGVWCHVCGVLLLNIDDVNKHLNKHGIDSCLTIHRSHSSALFDWPSVSEIFSCSICAVSFKSAFMIRVHEASFEHHSRLAACGLTDDVRCCSSCGLVMNIEGEGNGAIGRSMLTTKMAEASSKCMGLSQHQSSFYDPAKKASHVRVLDTIMQATSSAQGTCQTSVIADKVLREATNSFLVPDKGESALKVSLPLGSGELPVSYSGKTARDGEGVDRLLIENGLSACHDDSVRSQLGSSQCALNSKKGYMPTNIAADRNGNAAGTSSTTVRSGLASKENGTNHLPYEILGSHVATNSPLLDDHLHLTCAHLDDSIALQDPVIMEGQVFDGNGSEPTKKASFADTAVPIVVAATFAPLGTLQETLQSITAIVTESLSSALPSYMQRSPSVLKRKSQFDVEEERASQQDVKRMCPQRILKAALCQGLQSVCPNASMPKGPDVQCQGLADSTNVSHRIMNEKDVNMPQAVVAVAASVIPNGLQDSSRPASEHVQAEGNKAQESSAMRSGDDSTKREPESMEVKSESLLQVVVGDQGSAGSTRGKRVVEEKPTQVEISPSLLCTGSQNFITSTPVSLAKGGRSCVKNEFSLPAKKLANPMGFVESGISKDSKSNGEDDDDYYAFLDPTKGQLKWWSSSDSEGSDSVSK